MSSPQQKDLEPIDGVIKFSCDWTISEPLNFDKKLQELDTFRQKLYNLHLIGEYPVEKVGFGNISQRTANKDQNQFIITGSATGKTQKLNGSHYCTVNTFDLDKNCLTCTGPIKASSESMTHGTLYKIDPEIEAIVHVHNFEMWEALLNDQAIPRTRKDAQYGTPEIAHEVERLFNETNVREMGIFALEGHKDGIFTFGKTLEEAYSIIFKYYEKIILKH